MKQISLGEGSVMRCRTWIKAFLIMVSLRCFGLKAEEEFEPKEFLNSICDGSSVTCKQAALQVVNQYQAISEAVVTILKTSDRKNEGWLAGSSPGNMAVYIAGEMRISDAVPYLISRLEPVSNTIYVEQVLQYPPAAKALIKIGFPAVEPILEAAKKGPHNTIHFESFVDGYHGVIESILSEIGGREFAIWKIENSISKETDKNKRAHLQKVLKVSKSRLNQS